MSISGGARAFEVWGRIERLMEARYVPCVDSAKYNDHLAEMAQFNTVPVHGLTVRGVNGVGFLADIQ